MENSSAENFAVNHKDNKNRSLLLDKALEVAIEANSIELKIQKLLSRQQDLLRKENRIRSVLAFIDKLSLTDDEFWVAAWFLETPRLTQYHESTSFFTIEETEEFSRDILKIICDELSSENYPYGDSFYDILLVPASELHRQNLHEVYPILHLETLSQEQGRSLVSLLNKILDLNLSVEFLSFV